MKFTTIILDTVRVKAINVPEWEMQATPFQRKEAMRVAEKLGFYKIACPEHFIIPNDHLDLTGAHYLHAATGLGFAAGVTEKMRLTSNITILPLQQPIQQAKMWASLDWLSGGRADLNVGVGWLKEEFDILGVDFHKRGKITDEYLEAMIELWEKDNPSFDGQYVKFHDVGFEPKPIQRPMPLWFGGDADGALKRIARFGTGWMPFLTKPDDIPNRIDFIKSQPNYSGKLKEISYSIVSMMLGPNHEVIDAPEAKADWNAQRMIDLVGQLQKLGVTETSVPRPELKDFEHYLDWMRWCAEEIMAKVK
jgi:probable F420-dependent oxidoreductase